jgi:formiminotetrahydrofolate cyclodeaminase
MTIVTELTAVQFTAEVSRKQHAMAGAVIALSAVQSAALGQACLQISRDRLGLAAAEQPIARMAEIKASLLQWCDRDADGIAEYVALREAGETLAGQRLLCHAPAEVSRLSSEATRILQDFRPLVHERVWDDLEMSLSLLAGTAQAAMLLLDSNLRIWAEERPLLAEFEPVLAELIAAVADLAPVERIRSAKMDVK